MAHRSNASKTLQFTKRNGTPIENVAYDESDDNNDEDYTTSLHLMMTIVTTAITPIMTMMTMMTITKIKTTRIMKTNMTMQVTILLASREWWMIIKKRRTMKTNTKSTPQECDLKTIQFQKRSPNKMSTPQE